MNERGLAALTGAILVLVQLQLLLLPDHRADSARRTAALHRLGIEYAALARPEIAPLR